MLKKHMISQDRYILGYGNALLDMTVSVDESMLQDFGLAKGQMHLVDKQKSDQIIDALLANMTTSISYSAGGSTGNTCAQIGMLGTPVAFRGVVGEDSFGETYRSSMEKSGVDVTLARASDLATGHAITMITPDGERTFATYLGAAITLSPEMIDLADVDGAALVHIEGYLLEGGTSYEAMQHVAAHARQRDIPISIDLCDASLVERRFDQMSDFVQRYATIVFANREELCELTGTDDFDAAIAARATRLTPETILWAKNGVAGSACVWGDQRYDFAVHAVDVINTNGAGDMYAAAVLHGMAYDRSPELIGPMASHLSGLVVASHGARIDERWWGELDQYKNS